MHQEEDDVIIVTNAQPVYGSDPLSSYHYGTPPVQILYHHDEPPPEQFAPDEPQNNDRKSHGKPKPKSWDVGVVLGIAFLVAVILIIGVVFGVRSVFGGGSKDDDDAVTSAPSPQPSATTTSISKKDLEIYLLQILPNHTVAAILANVHDTNTKSAQREAFDWILNDPHGFLPPSQTNYPQRFALATLFFSTNGDKGRWFNSQDWLSYDVHECDWYSRESSVVNANENLDVGTYVTQDVPVDTKLSTCTTEGVYQNLWLYSNGLQGTLPSELFELIPTMKSIDLSGNDLNGRLPTLWSDAHNNRLLGEIQNNFSGSIGSEVGLLHQLEFLGLSFNKLTSSIPSEIALLWNLRGLYLDHNSLGKQIPYELGLLTKLSDLWLHNNFLSGSLPTELCLMSSNLEGLRLSNNAISNQMPTELGQLSSLRELDLSSNILSGSIVSDLGLALKLESLDLQHNNLQGFIPSELGILATIGSLKAFDIKKNSAIFGSIPEALCSIPDLAFDCTNLCGCNCRPCGAEESSNIFSETSTQTDTQTESPTMNATTFSEDTNITESYASAATGPVEDSSTSSTVCYFVIAGQSNVLGSASLDHLKELTLQNQSAYSERYGNPPDQWITKDDVFVSFDREYGDFETTLEGKLNAVSFGGNNKHFGPEVGFGFEMAELVKTGNHTTCMSIVIVKAGGVAPLASEWNAPNGSFFQTMIPDVKDAMSRVVEITQSSSTTDPTNTTDPMNITAALAGVIWFHGYADGYETDFLAQYQDNLEKWIEAVREAFSSDSKLSSTPLPILVAQMGGQGSNPGELEIRMRNIQSTVVEKAQEAGDTKIALTNTSQFVTGFNMSEGSPDVYDSHWHYWGRADVIINVGEQLAKDMWNLLTT